MKTFDLSQLDTVTGAEAGYVLEIEHPVTGQPVGPTITLRGEDSAAYKDAQRALQRRRLAQMVRGKRGAITPEQIEADALDVLVACTISWAGFTLKGEALECTEDNVRRVYTEFPEIREQVAAAVMERANFLPVSAKS